MCDVPSTVTTTVVERTSYDAEGRVVTKTTTTTEIDTPRKSVGFTADH